MKVEFTIEIESGNAAFGAAPEEAWSEVRRILSEFMSRQVGPGSSEDGSGPLRDINGNKVGEWAFSFEAEEEDFFAEVE